MSIKANPCVDLRTERMVLASVLSNEKCLDTFLAHAKAEYFGDPGHFKIFCAIQQLISESKKVSFDNLLAYGRVEKFDRYTTATISNLYEEQLEEEFLFDQIEKLKEVHYRRGMYQICLDGLQTLSQFEDKENNSDIIAWTDKIYSHMSKSVIASDSPAKSLAEILLDINNSKQYGGEEVNFLEEFQRRQELSRQGHRVYKGFPTHIAEIDNIFYGFMPGHLTLIAARPSVGKSSFMVNLFNAMHFQNKVKSALFSLEMKKEMLAVKQVFTKAQVDQKYWYYKTHTITPEQFHRLSEAYNLTIRQEKEMKDRLSVWDDTPRLSVPELRAKAHAYKRRDNIDIIFVDYAQLMTGGERFRGKYEEVTHISQNLKLIAMELNIPVVGLAQLNRGSTQGREKDSEPKMSEMRDSGSLEQDADEVFLLHKYDDIENRLMVILAKNRYGSTGKFIITFEKNTGYICGIKQEQYKDEDNQDPFAGRWQEN